MRDDFMTSIISRCPLLNDGERITLLQIVAISLSNVLMTEYDFAEARGVSESTIQNHIKRLKEFDFISVTYNDELRKSSYKLRKINILKKLKMPKKVIDAVRNNDTTGIREGYRLILNPEFRAKFTRRAVATKIKIPKSDRDARFLDKTRSKYTNQDIIRYYRIKYRERFRRDHRRISPYDKALCSDVLKKHNSKVVCDTIDLALARKESKSSMDFPTFCKSFEVFYKIKQKSGEKSQKTRINKR